MHAEKYPLNLASGIVTRLLVEDIVCRLCGLVAETASLIAAEANCVSDSLRWLSSRLRLVNLICKAGEGTRQCPLNTPAQMRTSTANLLRSLLPTTESFIPSTTKNGNFKCFYINAANTTCAHSTHKRD